MLDETFTGRAKRLDDIDIPRIGSRIGVGEDEIHAFMEVEAASSGFDSKGRPKMLFEPHVFYRQLAGEERLAAIEAGLAYRRWGEQAYPSDSYPRLIQAMKINREAALMSASWGLGQILGTNYRAAGYPTVEAMVEDFLDDEENHLEAMVNFIIANGIDDDLREHRWETVARVYNGAGYAKHGYHTRLATAYRKWARIADTPWDGQADDPDRWQTYPTVRVGSNGFVVTHLQQKLRDLNYHTGMVDGKFGAATRASVLAFQADHGLTTDGVVGQETWTVIEHSARPKPVSLVRQEATTHDLRKEGSSTIRNGDRGQIAGGVATATGALAAAGEVMGTAEDASGLLGRFQGVLGEFSAFLNDQWPLILIVGGAAAVYYIAKMKKARLDDHRSGANMNR